MFSTKRDSSWRLFISVSLSSATILFFTLTTIFSPLVPRNQRFILITSYVGFTNIMACRVFRGVALGMIYTEDSPGLTSTRIDAAIQLAPLQLSHHAPMDLP